MTAAHTPTRTLETAVARPSPLLGVAVSLATILTIIALAVLPLLTPAFVHAALDAGGSARFLGLDASTIRVVSDGAVADLLSPAGTFAIEGPAGAPFFDASERAHLADARMLLWLTLAAGLAGAIVVAVALLRHPSAERRYIWGAISRGGAAAATGAMLIGLVGALAFGALFTLFHQIAFPSGNWAFDPASQRLVQLYPLGFWQVAAGALGVLVIAFGSMTWWVGRRAASSTARSSAGSGR
jgi:hypothetical protein